MPKNVAKNSKLCDKEQSNRSNAVQLQPIAVDLNYVTTPLYYQDIVTVIKKFDFKFVFARHHAHKSSCSIKLCYIIICQKMFPKISNFAIKSSRMARTQFNCNQEQPIAVDLNYVTTPNDSLSSAFKCFLYSPTTLKWYKN
jgi:hypothetical protein